MGRLHEDFLRLLACPVAACRDPLRETESRLVCDTCGRSFVLEEKWPVLIPDDDAAPSGEAPSDAPED